MRVRYDQPDEKGQTRRERNENFDAYSPPCLIPDGAAYLWRWYWNMSNRLRRVREGVCEPVPPSEMLAWAKVSGVIVRSPEFAILHAMDMAFCAETNIEIQAWREREQETRRLELAASKARGKRGK